jgi:alpha-1,6-mannosyltransferase
VLGIVVVGVGAPLQSRQERALLGSWLTISTLPWRVVSAGAGNPHLILVAAVAALAVAWVAVAWSVRRRPVRGRVVLWAAGAWAAPFALAPPFLSRDSYAYLAQGQLLLQGNDPYREPVSALGGHSTLLQAVDPLWRHTVPPYGPLALRLEELTAWAGAGHPWLSLLWLRLLVLGCVVASVAVLRRAVPADARALVTWLAVSPLVLLQLVGALHLEAVVSLLLLAAAVLYRQGKTVLAAVAATGAAELKVTSGLVVLVLLISVWRRAGPHGGRRAAAGVLAASLATTAAGTLLLVRDPFGWVQGLVTPGRAWVPFTPSSTLYLAVTDLTHRAGLTLSPQARPVCIALGVLVGVAALLLVLHRTRGSDLATPAAVSLLVLFITGPVLWPWYLIPSALLLLTTRHYLTPLLLGAVPALAALPVGIVLSQRTGFTAELAGLAVFLLARHTHPTHPITGTSGASRGVVELHTPVSGLLSRSTPPRSTTISR